MTIKRLILGVLTILAVVQVTLSLLDSWNQPQIQSRLELYQTNLILHAAEGQDENASKVETPEASIPNLTTARKALLGEEPFKNAQKQYQDVRDSAKTNLEKTQGKLQQLQTAAVDQSPDSVQEKRLQASISKLEQLIDELDLRLGILQAHQGETETALKTWTNLSATDKSQAKPADILVGLWSQQPRLPLNAQQVIEKNLDSWFRYRALTQLYQVEERQDELRTLQVQEAERAEQAVVKLAIVGAIPLSAVVGGVGLLIFLLAQLSLQGKQAFLAQNAETRWTTPWGGETIWQVFILGFFFVGQVVVPLLFSFLPLNPTGFDIRMKAFYVLASYVLVAAGGLLVLYLSLKPFLPLPDGWFDIYWRGNWFLWGLGGYLVALPLVIVVSLINQQLWQGQGGSNPILPIALEGKDGIAKLIFFLTASIAAPLFEEILFRGFLLPSLTRYLPVWGAILASSLLFAVAHLNLSEVLPLAVLGMVLGFVYSRSRNLLSSMLLHSLWNSGTLLSLFLLGSGSS